MEYKPNFKNQENSINDYFTRSYKELISKKPKITNPIQTQFSVKLGDLDKIGTPVNVNRDQCAITLEIRKTGKRRAIAIVPIMPPITMIMIGSIMDVAVLIDAESFFS